MTHRCRRFMLVLAAVILSGSSAGVGDVTVSCWEDSFDHSEMNPQWEWLRENRDTWTLDPSGEGRLTIATEPGGLLHDQNNARNMLMTEAPRCGFDMMVHLTFAPEENFHFAGLIVYGDDDNFLALGRAYCDRPEECVGNGIYFDHEEDGVPVGGNCAGQTDTEDQDYIRLIRVGSHYVAYRSANGADWQLVGIKKADSLVPTLVGIGAWGGQRVSLATFAKVTLNPDCAPKTPFVGAWRSEDAFYYIEDHDDHLVMINERTGQAYDAAYTGTLHFLRESPEGPVHDEATVVFDDSGRAVEISFASGTVLRR